MSAEKLSPRQQMIGIMYLVLLAMLAMNASKDLLNAFIFLEDGIDVTTKNFNNTNQTIYTKISNASATGSRLAVQTDKNAVEIGKSSNKLFNEIEKFKDDIIEIGGGLDEETNLPLGKDNQDVGAEYLVVKGHGKALKQKICDYKILLTNLIDKRDTGVINGINKLLKTPEHIDYEGVKSPWENGISEYLPLAAVTANLTNIQSYIRNAESQVLSYLFEQINQDSYKVNKIMATSIAENGYVLQGDQYSANIFLAAADTTQEPIVIIGDFDTAYYNNTGQIKFTGPTDSLPVDAGIGKLRLDANTTGNHTWGGIMKVPHPNPKRKGEYLIYPFVNNYTVAAPSAVISSDQLNIMYMGLDNEISISAPGMKSEDLIVTASNRCKVTSKGNGKYIFIPKRGGKIDINVSANINGLMKPISKQTWKSKRLPKPEIIIPGVKGGKASANSLAAVLQAVGAKPQYDPSFPISTKPKIIEIKAEINSGGTLNPGRMTKNGKSVSQTNRQIRALNRGHSITIYMKAKGADGITHSIQKVVTIR